jgi:hypothetical protein
MKIMRNSILLLFFGVMIYAGSYANGRLINQQQLRDIQSVLGPNWLLREYRDEIEIASRTQLWFYNCVSLPYFSDNREFFENVVKGGREEIYRLRFIFVPRWSSARIKQARERNERIEREINGLPEKYRLSHLSRNKMNSFFSDDEEEKKRIKEYEIEYEELRGKIVILPDFHTEEYSVFIRNNRLGYECVWLPEGYSLPVKKIKEIISGKSSSN